MRNHRSHIWCSIAYLEESHCHMRNIWYAKPGVGQGLLLKTSFQFQYDGWTGMVGSCEEPHCPMSFFPLPSNPIHSGVHFFCPLRTNSGLVLLTLVVKYVPDTWLKFLSCKISEWHLLYYCGQWVNWIDTLDLLYVRYVDVWKADFNRYRGKKCNNGLSLWYKFNKFVNS